MRKIGLSTSTPRTCAVCLSAVTASSRYWASTGDGSYLSSSKQKIGSASRYLKSLLQLILVTDCYT